MITIESGCSKKKKKNSTSTGRAKARVVNTGLYQTAGRRVGCGCHVGRRTGREGSTWRKTIKRIRRE